MSIQSVVNTNTSSVSDPNGNRGNFPQGVMAFNAGTATIDGPGGTLDVVVIGPLIAGSETIGCYQGDLPAGLPAALGVQQTLTMTFAVAHGWTSLTHDIEVKLVGVAADAAGIDTGHCSGGSFGTTTTIEFQRRAGQSAAQTSILQACDFQVTVRKRGVTQVP